MPKSIVARFLKKILYFLPNVILVIIAVPIIGISVTEGSKLLGLKAVPVPVVGTGSMYPSLFWAKSEGGPEDDENVVIEEYRSTPHLYKRFIGIDLLGKKYFKRTIGRGDMVAFQNDQTQSILESEKKDTSAGFIKRVIGLPGDVIELRDGFVYIGGELISEPYIAVARSTYGGEFLKDCQKLTIPPGKYFVLGDNRKVSSDSRFELGLVDEGDIKFILPLNEQNIYHSLWRDTSTDDKLAGSPTLSSTDFVKLVNIERSNKKISPLILTPSLSKSSSLRGQKLLINPNTSYDMKQAVSSANYSNILLGEFISHGHYSAKELLANLLYNASSAKQILSSEYDDIGISAVNLDIDGCPSQIIVGHLGGYIPASYDPKLLLSWQRLQSNLAEVIPSWEKATESKIDQSKLSELLTILRRRLNLAQEVVQVMEKREWLSDSIQARIDSDQLDADRSEILSKELNGQ